MAVREKKIELIIKAGETEASFLGSLDNGFILGAELHTNHTDIDNLAEIGIFDDGGIPIARSTHINHWKRREGAGFNESYKPLLFATESKTYSIKAIIRQPTKKETYFQLILMYRIEPPKMC